MLEGRERSDRTICRGSDTPAAGGIGAATQPAQPLSGVPDYLQSEQPSRLARLQPKISLSARLGQRAGSKCFDSSSKKTRPRGSFKPVYQDVMAKNPSTPRSAGISSPEPSNNSMCTCSTSSLWSSACEPLPPRLAPPLACRTAPAEFVGFNKVLTSSVDHSFDDPNIQRVEGLDIKTGVTSKPSESVTTHGEWFLTWEEYRCAALVAFPHRGAGLVAANLRRSSMFQPTVYDRRAGSRQVFGLDPLPPVKLASCDSHGEVGQRQGLENSED